MKVIHNLISGALCPGITFQYYLTVNILFVPISIAERSEASTVFGRSNVGMAGSNPARGMDVCLRFSVLCCPV
jgi:hypothetical protein